MSDITQISLNGTVYDLRDKKWLDSITNCVTEIPQDIKLELNAGTLTLKAGSKVYVPNGAGVFDVVTIANDITMDGGTATGTELVYVRADGNLLIHYKDNSSGTDWTATSQYQCRYNTSANMIKNTSDAGSTWIAQLSFPIAKITLSSGTVTSVDQVFNGFGYIGSTVFCLKGVKGLRPDGRNSDGTLKNTAFETSTCLTWTDTITANGRNIYLLINSDTSMSAQAQVVGTQKRYYDPETNYYWNGSTYISRAIVGIYDTDANIKISALETKQPFHAIDYNDTGYVAHQAMPSDKYIDLTLPATGGTITVPADGYLYVSKASAGSGEYMQMRNNTTALGEIGYANSDAYVWLKLPCKKGDVITFTYNLSGSTAYCRFIYAEGVK